MNEKANYSLVFSWEEFLDRYLKNNEEFCFLYKHLEIHLAFYVNNDKQTIAEFNYGTKEKGYFCFEYFSPHDLLSNARIDGKTLQEIWDELI